MGGRSRGGPEVEQGVLTFSGVLSLENNGGFSSVRTVGRDFDFSDATAVVLRVRGDGRRYQLRLATDARFRGITVSYGGEFATEAGQWTEVRVLLADLRPSAHGFALQGPPLDASRIRELGLLIDAQEPLSNLIACTGSAACGKGLADSKADALRLAERLRASTARPQVHLSACPRSCAAAHTAPFTLLASSAGHYQLYQRTPEAAGFGQLLASAMTIDEAGDWFAAHCATGNSDA